MNIRTIVAIVVGLVLLVLLVKVAVPSLIDRMVESRLQERIGEYERLDQERQAAVAEASRRYESAKAEVEQLRGALGKERERSGQLRAEREMLVARVKDLTAERQRIEQEVDRVPTPELPGRIRDQLRALRAPGGAGSGCPF